MNAIRGVLFITVYALIVVGLLKIALEILCMV